MKSQQFSQTLAIFVVLTIAAVCLVVLSQNADNAQVRTVLPLLGAAMFCSALTFFLLQIVNRIK